MVRFGRKEEKEGEKIKEQREQQGLGKGGEEGGRGGKNHHQVCRGGIEKRQVCCPISRKAVAFAPILFFSLPGTDGRDGVWPQFFSPPPFFFLGNRPLQTFP